MRWIDVSMPLRPGMPTFPGDPAFVLEPTHRVDRGDAYSASRLVLGSHAGTHVDPPRHFAPDASGVDRLDPSRLIGPCEVVSVPPDRTVIAAADIPALPPGTERVLFRTANSERWERSSGFFPEYVALGADAPAALLAQGVRTVGLDALSIEADPTERYPVHRALLGADVVILEGLLLGGVRPGRYELVCLPLRIEDGDGGPARAVLGIR
jgi:arylformamidase